MLSKFQKKIDCSKAIWAHFRVQMQKWLLYRKFDSFLISVAGINILDPNFKLTFLSTLGGIMGADCFITMIYGMYYCRDHFFVALQGLTAIGALLLVSICESTNFC